MTLLLHSNFFWNWWSTGFNGQSSPMDGDTFLKLLDGDTFLKLLDGVDLSSIRGGVSGLVRAVGFGPEADNIALLLIGIFFFLVIIGYAAGPKSDVSLDKAKSDDKKDTNKK